MQCQKDCGEFISWLCTLGAKEEGGQLELRANGGGGGGGGGGGLRACKRGSWSS